MRITHVADTHIGMTNFGKLNPDTGLHTRLEDFDRALGEVVATSINQSVDAFVFAGDAYKNASPTPTYRNIFEQRMKELIDAGIPIAMIVGNHDNTGSYGTSSALRSFHTLAGIHIVDTPQNITLDTRSGPLHISCMPWPTRRMLMELNTEYHRLPPEDMLIELQRHIITRMQEMNDEMVGRDGIKIFLGHVDIEESTYSSEQSLLVKSSLVVPVRYFEELTAYAYIALGHIHRYQHLEQCGTPIVYSGSIERVDFTEEKEAKGFCLVTLEDNVCTSCEFLALDCRKLITIRVDLNGQLDLTQYLIDAICERDYVDSIIRIYYTLHTESAKYLDLARVHTVLKQAHCVHGLHHITEDIVNEPIELTHQRPLDVIAEYIDQYPNYRSHKTTLLQRVKEYATIEE